MAHDSGAERERVRGAGASVAQGDTEERLLPALELAFAPLHKAAFGTATGVAGALLLAALTVVKILSPRAQDFPLGLLAQYFAGYSATWGGVLVGAVWGFTVAFVAGWFVAFCRNLALAIVVFTYRTRAEIAQTREFLDHI
ncbi:MAG: hypothetical protein IPF98_06660 [Gemmatimonadetes bacterium]|nr:hypothetical protein [Gemmatimonadota bacterium]MCC6774618.1 hypothetical protein [Gemmatimonadaceae bacterium]